jgi:hypothetical protein
MINGNTPSVDPNTTATRSQPRCAGKSGAMYVTYIPEGNSGNTITFRNVTNGTYVSQWFNPRTGAFSSIGSGAVNGTWTVPARPDGSDWVVLLKRSTVTGSTSFFGSTQAIPGTIQAEDFDNGGEGVGYHDTDGSNNGGAYRSEGVDIQATHDSSGNYDVGWTRAGEWLQYTVNVAANGAYTLEVRVASDGPGGTFHVEFGGQDKTGPITVPNTGGWQSWQTLTRTVNLSAGQQVMRIVMDVASTSTLSVANMNYFRFTSGGAIPGTIQAEDFDAGGDGVGYHDTDASNNGGAYRNEGVDIQATKDTGGGYDVGWTRTGEWLRYTVNVAASGAYTLQARVASDGPGGTFHVEFNGVDVTGPMTVPNTGGWESWQTITRQVTLNAGQQTMRIVMDSANPATNSIGNFNYVRF